MLETSTRHLDVLRDGHPCQGCEARGRAVCGVLDCERLAQFRNLGSKLRLDAGEALFHEGDPATRVFTLTRGSLNLYKLLPDGRRQIVGFSGLGDFLGISVDDEHAFSAEALEHSELCCFSRRRFDEFIREHRAMEHELYQMAAHELAMAQLQLVLVGRKTASERMASFLLHLVQRAERAGGHQIDIVDLPMSRGDIADYLGLTKETVSRIFSTFRAARLIRLHAVDRVQILDRSVLEQLAESED